jgi:basic membrane protein A
MNFKKILSIMTALILVITMISGCSKNDKTKAQLSVGIVLGEGSINDQSFNESTWEGLQQAKEDFDINVKYLESQQESEYIQNIETFIDEEFDLIIGVGYQLKDAIEEVANTYPDKKFALLDETYDNVPQNVISVVFKEEEGAYLAGAVAAKMTETGNIGFIGGSQVPSVLRYQYGFRAGATDTNPDVKIYEQYANSFSDAAKGKSIAKQMHSSNVDIILTAAGAVGNGSIEAAREAGKYAIGVDRDQSDLAPENVITSVLKKLNVASYDLAKSLVEGNFKGGEEKVYGIKEDAVGIADNIKNFASQEVLDYIEEVKQKIVFGEITVPRGE